MKRMILFTLISLIASSILVHASPAGATEEGFELPDFVEGMKSSGLEGQMPDSFKAQVMNDSMGKLFPGWDACDTFSKSPGDYAIAIDISEDGENFAFVVHGRLADGKSFDDLMTAKTAYTGVFPIVDTNATIGAAKVVVWMIVLNKSTGTLKLAPVPLPYECQSIEDEDASGGQAFKCTAINKKTFPTNSLTADQLVFMIGEWPMQPLVFYHTPTKITGASDAEKLKSQCVSYPFTVINLLYAATPASLSMAQTSGGETTPGATGTDLSGGPATMAGEGPCSLVAGSAHVPSLILISLVLLPALRRKRD